MLLKQSGASWPGLVKQIGQLDYVTRLANIIWILAFLLCIHVCCVPDDPVPGGQCNNDSDCDDQQFCSGIEQCLNGICAMGNDPCQATGDPTLCDEESDTCIMIGCIDDADCDDQLFCNGMEYCLDGTCAASGSPCPPIGDCILCDEDADTCADVECIMDQDCDNGDPNDGTEYCADCSCHSTNEVDQ